MAGILRSILFRRLKKIEVEQSFDKIKTEAEDAAEIERAEMPRNSNSGDYSSSHNECSIRLKCRVSKTRKDRIKPGSCFFRYTYFHL